MLAGELTDTGHGGGNVLMNVTGAVFGVDQDADVLPVKAGRGGRDRNDE